MSEREWINMKLMQIQYQVYLTDDIYSNTENLESLSLEEYFKIYVVYNMKDKTYGTSELKQTGEIMGKNFIADNWENLKDQIEQKSDNLTIGVPVIFESHIPADNAPSHLLITKVSNDVT